MRQTQFGIFLFKIIKAETLPVKKEQKKSP